jgi:hypothetical protein
MSNERGEKQSEYRRSVPLASEVCQWERPFGFIVSLQAFVLKIQETHCRLARPHWQTALASGTRTTRT